MLQSRSRTSRRLLAVSVTACAALALAACSSGSVGGASDSSAPSASAKSNSASDASASGGKYASIIPKGDIVQASKDIIQQDQAGKKGFTPPDQGAKAQDPGATIAYVAADLSDGGITGALVGVKQAAKVIGWKVKVFDGQATVAGHTNAMGQAIAIHPAAIILGGANATEQASTIKQAEQEGIPVVGWHSTSQPGPGEGLKLNGSTDPLRVAQLAAAYAVDKSNGKAGAVIMEDSEYAVAITKAEAMAAYIKACSTCSMLELVNSPIAAVAQDMPGVISSALQKFGQKFTYLLAINGNYFSGAAPSLKSAGKAPEGPPYGIAAGDGVASEFQRIRKGQYQTATVAEPLYLQGWQLVDAINDILAKKPIPNFVPDPELIDKSNVPSTNVFDPDSGYRDVYKKIWGK